MDITILALFFLVGIGIFLLFRAFWLWYWKIDKIVELLEKIDDKITKPNIETVSKADEWKKPTKIGGEKTVECSCGKKFDHENAKHLTFCPDCGKEIK